MSRKSKVRVAFCLRDMQLGGVESVMIRTLEQLVKRDDMEISFVSYVKITEPVYVDWFNVHPEIKRYVLYPCPWLGTKLRHFFLLRFVQHVMRDVYRWARRVFLRHKILANVDVVVDYYDFGFRKELRRVSAKKIAWWHSSINKFLARASYINYVKYYDLFVTLTDGFVDEFKTRWPQYKKKIVRMYNPMDIDAIRARANSAPSVGADNYFVCVSRLAGDKDIETVLRGFDKFVNENNNPDVRMVFVGGGDVDKYRAIANKLSAHEKIEFVGAQKNPMGFMRGAMANILSSYSEGLPTVLLEAMAVGTVNISSDCKNGPREILLDGDAGLLFAPGNADELAQHMDKIWNNKIAVEKLKNTATKSLARFDAVQIATDVAGRIKTKRRIS
ncbi:MAG: glycosyltransferase [Alphaproteobacteria bacterium]|nr:glycosyltransferase [Alphaproteobacteria bacterium]